jgi:hypothetical protein
MDEGTSTGKAHAKFSSRDADLVYGLDGSGHVRHISEVESGLACGCACPSCGKLLIARKGSARVHHFGHQASFSCAGAPETALHKLAKEIISEQRRLVVPEVTARYRDEIKVFHPRQTVQFDKTVEEARHLNDFIPDLYAEREGRRLLVEIYVTHACDELKRAELRKNGIATIEIDLSRCPRNASRSAVEEAVFEAAPRTWLFHPKIDAAVADMHARHMKAEDAQRRKFDQRVAASLSRYERGVAALASRTTIALDPTDEFIRIGLGSHVGCAVGGAGGFVVSEREWQFAILHQFLPEDANEPTKFKHAALFKWIKERDFISRDFQYIHPEIEDAARELNASFRSPYRAVEAYLDEMVSRGVLENVKSYWLAYPYLDRLRQLRSLEHRKVTRTKNLVERAERIIAALPENERGSFCVEAWMAETREDGLSLRAAIAADFTDFDRMLAPLSAIETMMFWGLSIAKETFGLPVALEIERRTEAKRLEAAAKEAERIENLRLASEARANHLKKEASRRGDDWLVWIENAHEGLAGRTPLQAAAASEVGMLDAFELLRQEADTRDREVAAAHEILRWQADLEREVIGILGNATQPFLNSPYLLGTSGRKFRPRDYCQSKLTFLECVELAKSVLKKRR